MFRGDLSDVSLTTKVLVLRCVFEVNQITLRVLHFYKQKLGSGCRFVNGLISSPMIYL